MGVVKAQGERGLRRTLRAMYLNPHPQFTVGETEVPKAAAVSRVQLLEAAAWQMAEGRKNGEVTREREGRTG